MAFNGTWFLWATVLAALAVSEPAEAKRARINLSCGDDYDFGTVLVGNTADHAFTLSNAGNASATSLSASLPSSFIFKGGAYPGTGGSCGSTLHAKSSCTLIVSFAPNVRGKVKGELLVRFHNGKRNRTTSAEISGTGEQPAGIPSAAFLVLSDGPLYDFGTVLVDESAEHLFLVTNVGQGVASSLSGAALPLPFSFKGGSYPGVGGSCGASLAGNDSCSIVVSLAPSVQGVYQADVVLHYEDGSGPQSAIRGIKGKATTKASLSLSDSPLYTFGTAVVGSSRDHAFTLTNHGEFPASQLTSDALASGFHFKGGAYPGEGGDCAGEIAGGGTCTLVVSFSPTVSGNFLSPLRLAYYDGSATKTISMDIGGTALKPAALSISGAPRHDFGGVETSQAAANTFTVTNTGHVGATSLVAGSLAGPFAYRGGAFPGTEGTCETNLLGGASCTIAVTFSPTTPRTFSSTLILTFHDGSATKESSVELAGQGLKAPQPGDLDLSFAGDGKTTPPIGSSHSYAEAVTTQADGKILVAGYLTSGAQFRILLSRFQANGEADSSFGIDGVVTTAIGPSDDRAYSVALRPDGKILVAGFSFNGLDKDIAVVQYLSDGNLDPAFGSGLGYVTTDISFKDDAAYAIVSQADGKIAIAGYSFVVSDRDFLLVRYFADGALDARFNGSGALTMDFGVGHDEARALRVQPDGKYLLAGHATTELGGTSFALTRFTTTGRYDNAFNGNATVVTNLGAENSRIHALELQGDGKAVAVGQIGEGAGSKFALSRYATNGALDPTFGTNGVTTTALSPWGSLATGVGIHSEGKISVGGFAMDEQRASFTLARYTSAGVLDESFGNGGVVNASFQSDSDDRARTLYIQPSDGKIIMAGSSSTADTTTIALARFLP